MGVIEVLNERLCFCKRDIMSICTADSESDQKTANSAKSRLLQIDVCTICLMSIAIAWMHK